MTNVLISAKCLSIFSHYWEWKWRKEAIQVVLEYRLQSIMFKDRQQTAQVNLNCLASGQIDLYRPDPPGH